MTIITSGPFQTDPMLRRDFYAHGMPEGEEFVWDAHAHPDHRAWLDSLRAVGWQRDDAVPGVLHPDGTTVFRFVYDSSGT